MTKYAVIVQNDESKWDDIKGDLYNYPATYKSILTPGCRVIYYKGRMTKAEFLSQRLTKEAHYFGIGVIGSSIIDPDSPNKDRYCEIMEYREFEKPVPIKLSNEYFESIPESKKGNYWRFGVREISKNTYERIISHAVVGGYHVTLPNPNQEFESFQPIEGGKKVRYTSYYERNPFYRNKAIEIHGFDCMACGTNFENKYGPYGKGYIHVHHNKPISESGPTKINPKTDMSVLCPNCHAMVHRRKDATLTVEQVREMLQANTTAT